MSHQFRSALQAMAAETADRRMHVRLGTVTEYNPALHAAKVMVQPEGYETDFVPFRTSWVGAHWGLYSPPSAGDQVVVAFEDGAEYEGAVILGGIFSDAQPPLSVDSGEFWLFHKGGSFLKFTNDGRVLLNTQADLIATVGGDCKITVAGATTLTSVELVTVDAPELHLTGKLTVDGVSTFGDVMTVNANANFANIVEIGEILASPTIVVGDLIVGDGDGFFFGESKLTVDHLTVNKTTDLTGPVQIVGSLHTTGAVTGDGTAAYQGIVSSLADVKVGTISLPTHVHTYTEASIVELSTGGPPLA